MRPFGAKQLRTLARRSCRCRICNKPCRSHVICMSEAPCGRLMCLPGYLEQETQSMTSALTFTEARNTSMSCCKHLTATAAHAGSLTSLALRSQVLDYQNVAADLLGGVASAYALKFMGQAGIAMYRQFEADRDRGDFSILPELHSTLSALKVRTALRNISLAVSEVSQTLVCVVTNVGEPRFASCSSQPL